jgi:hypothetical protein
LCKNDLQNVNYSKSIENTSFLRKRTDILKNINIFFENEDILEKFTDLTSFKCLECLQKFKNLNELKKHLRNLHSKVFCQVCLKEKKEFVNLLTVFTDSQVKIHVKNAHEECLFCQIKFYDKDCLFQHLKKEHEVCFLCKRLGKDLYFQNYFELEKHFQEQHFTCQEEECLEKKFVVFENEIELKSHYLQEHSDKKLHKSFRKLDLQITFNQEPTQSNSQSEFKRKIPKEFGNKLTKEASETTVKETGLKETFTEKDIVLHGIHDQEVLSKISDLLLRDLEKYSEFISIYEAFKGNLVSGKEFLNIFIETSHGNLREIERVWKSLADLTPILIPKKMKKKGIPLDLNEKAGNPEMLKAWNDFKIKNSNHISHWDNVDNTWATNAQLKTQNTATLLHLSRSNLPSKPATSLANSTWANRPSSSTGGNLEEFPSLPTSSRPVSSGYNGSRSSGSSDTVEWKKKGKKKVLLHFG